jgi:hypothetical protein
MEFRKFWDLTVSNTQSLNEMVSSLTVNQFTYMITTLRPFEGLRNFGLHYSRTNCNVTGRTRIMRTVLKTSHDVEITLRKRTAVPVTSPIILGTLSELRGAL